MARAVAARIDIPHVELDALHWGPNWTCPPRLEFRALVARALSRESWIVDGNYSKVRDIIWVRADTIVWLDYSLPVTLWRLTRRTLRRLAKREVLWNGNRESWRQQFLSRESLFLWSWQTHGQHRRTFPQLFSQTEFAHLNVVKLNAPERQMAGTLLWTLNRGQLPTGRDLCQRKVEMSPFVPSRDVPPREVRGTYWSQ